MKIFMVVQHSCNNKKQAKEKLTHGGRKNCGQVVETGSSMRFVVYTHGLQFLQCPSHHDS